MPIPVGLNVWSRLVDTTFPYLDQTAAPFDSLFPGLGIPGWHGIFAPGGTPRPLLDRLAADIRSTLALPAVANRFREVGLEPSGVSGDEFNAIVRRDYARWGEIIRANKLQAD